MTVAQLIEKLQSIQDKTLLVGRPIEGTTAGIRPYIEIEVKETEVFNWYETALHPGKTIHTTVRAVLLKPGRPMFLDHPRHETPSL